MSLAELARKVHYSRGYLSKVENGRAPGNLTLAERCDAALGTGGLLAKLAAAAEPRGRPRPPKPGRETAAGGAPIAPVPLPLALAGAVAFMLALDEAHNSLRQLAVTDLPPDQRLAEANRAVHDAGLYATREQLLVSAPAGLVVAGESAFLRLIAVRDAIRTGARLDSADYHNVYHPFAEALWSLRMALRQEFGQQPLTPGVLDRTDWSDRERCPACDGTP